MNYILFSTKSVIEFYKNNIDNLLDAKEIDFDLFHVLHNSSLEEILYCTIKWSGFDKKTEKLGLISKVYYENLTPNERTTVLSKKLE